MFAITNNVPQYSHNLLRYIATAISQIFIVFSFYIHLERMYPNTTNNTPGYCTGSNNSKFCKINHPSYPSLYNYLLLDNLCY